MGEIVRFSRQELAMATRDQMYYDKWGAPLAGDFIEQCFRFSELFADRHYSQIMDTYIYPRGHLEKEFRVSTIWLGIDYNFGSGIPVCFETMVFGEFVEEEIFGNPVKFHGALGQWRWRTVEEARGAHMMVVEQIQHAMHDPITRFVQPSLRAIENTVRASEAPK